MEKREILKTDRLILRPFKLSDAETVQRKAGDKAVVDTTLNIPYPYPDGIAKEWISTHQSEFEAGKSIVYGITLKDDDEIIGAIGLINIEKEHSRAELGYWIEKELWGNGYCTEAARAILEYGFNKFGLHKIFAEHISRNPQSGRVMEKLGMKKEGFLKEHVIKWDKYEDILAYGILKHEWNTKK